MSATSAKTAVASRDVVEEQPSDMLRSGVSRRAVLAANTVTRDLHVFGADNCLRVFNPKASSLCCIQLMRPQLLDHSFWPWLLKRLEAHGTSHRNFWQEPPHVQKKLVDECFGTDNVLHGFRGMPHEVVEIRLDEASGCLALVGKKSVSIMVPPSPDRIAALVETIDELGGLLAQLGLSEYASAMREKGYTNMRTLRRMNADERKKMVANVGMKPGHEQTLSMHLDGRLPSGACSGVTLRLVKHTCKEGETAASVAAQYGADGIDVLFVTQLFNATAVADTLPEDTRSLIERITMHQHDPLRAGTELQVPRPFDHTISGEPVLCWALPLNLATPAREPSAFRQCRGPLATTSTSTMASAIGDSVKVLQADWHPLGECHLGVLLSDGSFHLYDTIKDLQRPELTLRVPPDPDVGIEVRDRQAAPAGFSFCAATHRGWSSLSVYFASARGAIYVACPVLPNCERSRMHLLSIQPQLEASLDVGASHDALSWIRQRVLALSSVSPQLDLYLQGPLSMNVEVRVSSPAGAFPDDTPADARSTRRDVASRRALAVSSQPLVGGLTSVFLGWTDNTVSIGILTGNLLPLWAQEAPLSAATIATSPRSASPPVGGDASTDLRLKERPSVGGAPDARRASPRRTYASQQLLPRRARPESTPEGPRPAGSVTPGAPAVDVENADPMSDPLELLQLSTADLNSPSGPSEPLEWMVFSADSSAPERTFVHASGGVSHALHYPWLQDWAHYLHGLAEDDPALPLRHPDAPPARCTALALLATSDPTKQRASARVVGVAPVRDPSVGDAVFVMQNDGFCSRVQLERLTLGEAAFESGGPHTADSKLKAHIDVALKQSALSAPENVIGEKEKLPSDSVNLKTLKSASSHGDTIDAFSRSLQELVGPGSDLGNWGRLVEETKARSGATVKRAEQQPEKEKEVAKEVETLKEQLRMLRHKACMADALQQNLEMRSDILRRVLRTPQLCPQGELSEEERAQHRKLLAIRARVVEGQRALHKLVHEAGALPEAASVHDFNTPGHLESPQVYLLRSLNLPEERFEFETFAVSDLHSELKHQLGQLGQLRDQLEDSLTNSQTAIKTVEEARRQQRAMLRPAEAAATGGAAAAAAAAAEIQRAAAAPAPSTASASSSTVASGHEQRQ